MGLGKLLPSDVLAGYCPLISRRGGFVQHLPPGVDGAGRLQRVGKPEAVSLKTTARHRIHVGKNPLLRRSNRACHGTATQFSLSRARACMEPTRTSAAVQQSIPDVCEIV
jgi:hypothetical protein